MRLFITCRIANLLEKKHGLCYAMWYPIRCKTINVILENKDEVMSIVRHERISKLVTAAGGLVSGTMIGIGLLFAIPSLGVSLGLSAVGGVVGTLSAGTSLISYFTSIVKTNNLLRKAQQFVRLDQQFSNQLNAAAAKYSKALETYKEGAAWVLFEGGLQAASTVVVAVTVPLDVTQLVYNCYLLHKSFDSNTTIQCLIKQFEAFLKGQLYICHLVSCFHQLGFFHVTNTTDAYDGESSVTEYGYKVIVPPSASQDKPAATVSTASQDKPTVTVSTILSGPFNVPDGAVLVSAVYDIMIDENFKGSVTIEIEHCVDVLDESIAGKMFFAIARADLTKKSFEICPIDGGTFPKSSTYGSIKLKENCLLCVLVKDPM